MTSPGKLARVGKYQIAGHLKTGGMGAVYKAVDTETGREVALKVLSVESADNPKRLERFRREAQHGALLSHDNIVGIYDYGEVEGTYFLAMELIEGIDLEEYIRRRGQLRPDEARQILLQVAKALDHAHQLGVVHRDIKPSNILLAQQHGRTVVKVADLGLARGGIDEESRVTADGSTVGTVDYMSPEQARDSGAADTRSDIYSLGCTLYHMLAGQPPFADGSIVERVVKHAKAEPADLRRLNPDVPEDLWAVCRRMLAKKPSQRYQSPSELLVDLSAVVIPPPAPAAAPERPTRRRKRGARATTLAAQESTDDTLPADVTAEPTRIAAGQFDHGMQAVTSGNIDYGMMLLMNCCRLDPGNLTYRQGLRQAQLARRSMAGLGPWRSGPWRLAFKAGLKLGKALGRPLQVLRCGEELLCCDPTDVKTHVAMADAAAEAGHDALAVWLLEHARGLDADNLDVARALARAYEGQREPKKALQLWEEIAQADSGDREARNRVRDLLADETTQSVYEDHGRSRRARGDTSPRKQPPSNSLIT